MKATGIVRRIDDLGRVVVPKEIRRTLRIREGDPLEIFTDKEGEIILKKYSPIGELSVFAKQYAESLSQMLGCLAGICDMDQVVAAAGNGKKELQDEDITRELGEFLKERKTRNAKAGEKNIYARVSVDAMAGFDQDVLVTFDWAKRKAVNDDNPGGNGNNNNGGNNNANNGNGNQQNPANGNSSTGNQNNSSMKAPAAVKNLKKKKRKKKTLTLSWKKATDANGYEVYQATKAKGKYKKIKTISKAKTTKLTVKKLKAKKTYYFKVRAYKKNGKQKLFGTYSKVLRVKM